MEIRVSIPQVEKVKVLFVEAVSAYLNPEKTGLFNEKAIAAKYAQANAYQKVLELFGVDCAPLIEQARESA